MALNLAGFGLTSDMSPPDGRIKYGYEYLKIRRWTEVGEVFHPMIQKVSRIVRREGHFDSFDKRVYEPPDLGFEFRRPIDPEHDDMDEDEYEEFVFKCKFEIRPNYIKFLIEGTDHKGHSFSGFVNIFMHDELIQVGRRIALEVPDHPFD